ncbi:MAG: ComEC/Rec2 family competence protein [Lachnospiraceae bacterium]|nr:ComEC/Rec2 family competence protein [Lachnospiraceae bacterium]
MEEVKKRPLAVFCGGYLLSLLAGLLLLRGTAVFGPVCLFFALLPVVLLVVRIAVRRKKPWGPRGAARFLPLPFLLLSFALGLCAAYLSSSFLPRRLISLSDGQTDRTVTAVAGETVWSSSYGEFFYADLSAIDGEKARGRVLVRYQGGSGIGPGDCVTVTGTLSPFEEEENGFPEERYQLSRSCFASLDAVSVSLTGHGDGIGTFFSALTDRLEAPFSGRFEKETASFLSAILFGRRDRMPKSAERDFRTVGGSHLFAVSGLHVGILIGGIALLLYRLGLPRGVRVLILTVTAFGFVGLTGFSYSAIRAAFMIWFASLGDLLGEDADSVTSLFFGCSLICLVTPTAVLDIGLELSFAATLGILTVGRSLLEPLSERSRNVRAVAAPAAICLSALLFTLPVSWLYFGEISVLSPLTALLSVIPIPAVLTSAALFSVLHGVPVLGTLLGNIAGGLARVCLDGAAALAFPEALIPIRLPALIACVGTVILLAVLFRKKSRFFAVFVPVLSGFLVFGAVTAVLLLPAAKSSSVSFVSEKNRDALTVRDGGVTALIDIADGSYAAARDALSGVEGNLDVLILTHCHPSHIAQCARLGGEQYLSALYLPYPENESERSVAARLAETGLPLRFYSPGEAIPVGGAEIAVKRYFLARSSQPIVTVTVTGKETRTASVSGPLWEADPEAYRSLFSFDTVYFGSHGPSVKEPPDSYPAGAVLNDTQHPS